MEPVILDWLGPGGANPFRNVGGGTPSGVDPFFGLEGGGGGGEVRKMPPQKNWRAFARKLAI